MSLSCYQLVIRLIFKRSTKCFCVTQSKVDERTTKSILWCLVITCSREKPLLQCAFILVECKPTLTLYTAKFTTNFHLHLLSFNQQKASTAPPTANRLSLASILSNLNQNFMPPLYVVAIYQNRYFFFFAVALYSPRQRLQLYSTHVIDWWHCNGEASNRLYIVWI